MKNIIRDLRESRGLTQADLAQSVDVSRQTILAIELDKYDPTLALAFRLASFFDILVDDLFHYQED